MGKNSIFKKYLFISTIFMFLGIVIVGAVLLVFSQNAYNEDYYKTLRDSSDCIIASLDYVDELQKSDIAIDDYFTQRDPVSDILQNHALSIDASAFVVDTDGKIVYFSDDSGFSTGSSLPAAMLKQGSFCYTSNLNGFLNQKRCNCITSFIMHDKQYYLVNSQSFAYQSNFKMMIYSVYFLTAVVVFCIFMTIISRILQAMIRPLNDMTAVAKQYAKGDFTQRIKLTSDEGELNYLSGVLNDMADTVSKNEKVRKSFVANVSHELKTPMTSIGGFVEGIISNTIPPEQHMHYLHIIKEEVDRLSRLVRSMLHLSKFEADEMKVNYSEFDVSQLVIKTVLLFERKLNAKGVDVEGLDNPPVMLTADSDLIQQVLYNLTENAVKFVNDSGVVTYTIAKDGNDVCITIKNTGEGLNDDELPRIFDRFYKTDESRGKDKTGVGLGLSIVRSIVNLHNGSISVNSKKGSYTEFCIILPQKPSAPEDEE